MGKVNYAAIDIGSNAVRLLIKSIDREAVQEKKIKKVMMLRVPLRLGIIRKSKFPQNPKRSVRFSGKRTKRSVQKRKARNTQKAETKVL